MQSEKLQFLHQLLAILDYDPVTGFFTWNVHQGGHIVKGTRAGYINAEGYEVLTYKGCKFKAHRLAMIKQGHSLSVKEVVDHIDHNKTNNAYNNLRVVSRAENSKNIRATRKSLTGHQGIWLNPKTQQYHAYIELTVDGKKTRPWQKIFKDIRDARSERAQALLDLGFHPNHGKEE